MEKRQYEEYHSVIARLAECLLLFVAFADSLERLPNDRRISQKLVNLDSFA